MGYGSGSTGYEHAARVKAIIDDFYHRPPESQTSAVFANLWSSRDAHYPDIRVDYVIGGGEANTPAGWLAYLARLHRSSANTSTKSQSGYLGLADPVWRTFVSDHAAITAESTHVDGTTDADHGRRVYQFLVSTVVEANYRDGQFRELLEAWAAAGSSGLPST